MEVSTRGRPSSLRHDIVSEVAVGNRCARSNPSRVIGAEDGQSTKAGGSDVLTIKGVGVMSR